MNFDGQSKKASLVEAFSNTFIGYIINIFVQMAVFPLFNIEVSLGENLLIGVIFLCTSILRGYILRRVFNHFLRS